MKKKLLIALMAITAALCGAFGFAACGDKTDNSGNGGNGGNTEQGGNTGGNEQKPEHTTHTYDQKNTAEKYLKSEATCQHKAEYYFSCTCGEKGEETFEYGELGKHVFENYVSNNDATCVKNGTETAKCENCTVKDVREIENSKTGHSYTEKVAEAKYLKTEASCTQKAEYCYSCVCGEKGEETFEYGELAEHDFKTYVSDNNATCTKNCTETATCENCKETDSREVKNTKSHKLVEGVCEYCNKKFTEGLSYALNDDGISYKVIGIGKANDSEISILDIYEGLPVTSIHNGAFERCSSLTSVIIPDGVTNISGSAFYNCSSLSSIVIPDSLSSIGETAFTNCNYIGEIKYTGDLVNWCQNQIDGLEYLMTCGKSFKKIIVGDVEIKGDLVIPDEVTSISKCAFCTCSALTSVSLPEGITSIGYRAFNGCNNLSSIIIPDSVTNIGGLAFSGCRSLTSINIPEGVTRIGFAMFSGCSKLTSITYEGTKAQWNAIEKDGDWNSNTGNYTIHCTDGDISK